MDTTVAPTGARGHGGPGFPALGLPTLPSGLRRTGRPAHWATYVPPYRGAGCPGGPPSTGRQRAPRITGVLQRTACGDRYRLARLPRRGADIPLRITHHRSNEPCTRGHKYKPCFNPRIRKCQQSLANNRFLCGGTSDRIFSPQVGSWRLSVPSRFRPPQVEGCFAAKGGCNVWQGPPVFVFRQACGPATETDRSKEKHNNG